MCGLSAKGDRFTEGRKSETIIAAGDNLMDVSMLNRADIAFANQSIFDLTTCKNKIKIVDEIFYIFDYNIL